MMHSIPQQHTANRHAREAKPQHGDRDSLNRHLLCGQNRSHAGTGGVSQNNRTAGFVPGFFDSKTGTTVASRFANGTPAPVHVLDGLPDAWVSQRGGQGQVIQVRRGVIAGFLRGKQFYTREQAASLCAA